MPRIWNETIEAHRHAVRDAVLDATAALVTEHGLLSVTMSRIAQTSGIGRATLYKYFPDVEAVLTAWHERQITRHLDHLTAVRDRAGSPGERLEAVLTAYAFLSRQRHEHHGSELAGLLHQGHHVAHAHRQLTVLLRDLLTEGASHGELRDDVAPDELAAYCLCALDAAAGLPSQAAVHRLVAVTLSGLRPQPGPAPARSDEEATAPHPRHHRPH
ncbi:TetR/AcrR family transcriptional regulator [Streptomyces chromofuscus]|uniref:TetR/AcrR family transcriptional regulator n=1 Tax=Streptomyces chromofuscus TaxID=42881 RepID=A0A7M2T974_STRCW|nr:TetR/AcrR family transcriptional regulator [Streptomyces chromofuscus]QOV44804.1 TetR/AcrR family transcriptional regulator [Streptomyces chromofuscus]GGT00086.1 hypothetical protein GCM10010254_20150 [Streptomyces chromofuscus]